MMRLSAKISEESIDFELLDKSWLGDGDPDFATGTGEAHLFLWKKTAPDLFLPSSPVGLFLSGRCSNSNSGRFLSESTGLPIV
jgi:hypothetical protein